jgi:hypothetical protein
MCSLRYIRRIPRCALQMPLEKHGTAAGGLQALPRIITSAETQRRRSPMASARENDHAGIAATQCVTGRALGPSIRWRQNAVCLITCQNRSRAAGENHPNSYGIPMEYLWSTYGIRLEQRACNTMPTRHHHAGNSHWPRPCQVRHSRFPSPFAHLPLRFVRSRAAAGHQSSSFWGRTAHSG